MNIEDLPCWNRRIERKDKKNMLSFQTDFGYNRYLYNDI